MMPDHDDRRAAKDERLAEALRENLKRRKAQARERKESPENPSSD